MIVKLLLSNNDDNDNVGNALPFNCDLTSDKDIFRIQYHKYTWQKQLLSEYWFWIN